MSEYAFLVAAVWFPMFWIFGGVFFAIVAMMRVSKIRRARFSCLYTLLTAAFAYGAGYSGLLLGEARVAVCLQEAHGIFDTLAAVFGCAIFEILATGAVWFLLLLITGFFAMYLSKADNQSWVDSGADGEDEYDRMVTFDEAKEY